MARRLKQDHLKNRILFLLKEFPKTRDNDVYLTLKFWLHYYKSRLDLTDPKNPKVSFKDIMDLPREEHIRRIRAIIQNEEHKFLPIDPQVRKQRKISEREWSNYLQEERIRQEYPHL